VRAEVKIGSGLADPFGAKRARNAHVAAFDDQHVGRSSATRRLTSCGSESSHTTAPARKSSGSITSCVDDVAVKIKSDSRSAAARSTV